VAERIAVVLLSMGEPENLSDVRPYLAELLSDGDLVPLPAFVPRRLLAAGVRMFGGRRLRRSLIRMGGGSPLVRLTESQARALEAALRQGGNFRVYAAMRYGQPSIAEIMRLVRQEGATRIVALPLYPQYCRATSGSSLKALRDQASDLPVAEIRSWPDHPAFIAAWGKQIGRAHV
jgi:ferrochelatase